MEWGLGALVPVAGWCWHSSVAPDRVGVLGRCYLNRTSQVGQLGLLRGRVGQVGPGVSNASSCFELRGAPLRLEEEMKSSCPAQVGYLRARTGQFQKRGGNFGRQKLRRVVLL